MSVKTEIGDRFTASSRALDASPSEFIVLKTRALQSVPQRTVTELIVGHFKN